MTCESLPAVEVGIRAGAQPRILRVAIERQLAVALRILQQPAVLVDIGDGEMSFGTGSEVLEQVAGFPVGAFKISSLSAMGDDIPGGGDQTRGRAPAPCDARPATSVAPALRLPTRCHSHSNEGPAHATRARIPDPESRPAPASRWLARWASAAAESPDCVDRGGTPRRGRASNPTWRTARAPRAGSRPCRTPSAIRPRIDSRLPAGTVMRARQITRSWRHVLSLDRETQLAVVFQVVAAAHEVIHAGAHGRWQVDCCHRRSRKAAPRDPGTG